MADWLEAKLKLGCLWCSCRPAGLLRNRSPHWLWDHLALAVDRLALRVDTDGSRWNGLPCRYCEHSGWKLRLWDWCRWSSRCLGPWGSHWCRSGWSRNCLWSSNRAASLGNKSWR